LVEGREGGALGELGELRSLHQRIPPGGDRIQAMRES
jgi:hypothetical protein